MRDAKYNVMIVLGMWCHADKMPSKAHIIDINIIMSLSSDLNYISIMLIQLGLKLRN